MDLMIVIVALGLGIVLGIYVSSQISEHIESSTQDRDLMRNIREMEKKNGKND